MVPNRLAGSAAFVAAALVGLAAGCSDGKKTPGPAKAGAGNAGVESTAGGAAGGGSPSNAGGAATGVAGRADASGGVTSDGGSGGAMGNAMGGSSKGGGSATGGAGVGAGGVATSGGTSGAVGGGMDGTTGGSVAMGGRDGSSGSSGMGGVSAVIAGGVRWVGRADVSDATAIEFAWSGSGFVATVTGDAVSVKLRSDGGSDPIFFQPVVDGTAKARFSVASSEGAKTVSLGSGLGAGDHTIALYRETEGKAGYASSTFLGFAAGTPKDPPAYGGRLIEIVGDSISAGYGNLGSEQHPDGGADPSGGCHFSTDTQSAYLTYGAVAARALAADASIVAASGWGIYSDNGGSKDNVLPKVYANTVGGQTSPAWSFAALPQAVVINLGTNDFSANMSLAQSDFSGAYTAFLTTVRAKYPSALILCAIGPLLYGTGLTNATAYIDALVQDANQKGDKNIQVLNFGQQDATKGTGCDWHPNVAENQRMADLLVTALKTNLGW